MEAMRQVVHILLGLVIVALALAYGLETSSFLIFYLFVFYASFLYAASVGWLKLLDIFIRKNELYPGVGALYYLASALLLASYPGMSLDSFLAAILALSLGDGVATFVGKYAGRVRIANGKSLEGSVAGILASFLSYLVVGIPLMPALLLAFAFALIELFSPIDDNITIPLGIAFLAGFLL